MSCFKISIACFALIVCLSKSIYANEHETFTITNLTKKVYHRFYLIKRLEPSIALLQKKQLHTHMSFEAFDATLYKNKTIQATVERMRHEHSFDALFDLADTFKRYQHLHDPLFYNEYVHLIFFIYERVGATKSTDNSTKTSEQIASIDEATDTLMYGKKAHQATYRYTVSEVTTDIIAQRFCLIKRLCRCIQFLEYIHKQQRNSHKTGFKSIHEIWDLDDEVQLFNNDRIKECIAQMCKQKSLEPLVHVCREFRQYRYASDATFLQEMLMNIFLVYKSMLLKDLSEQAEQTVAADMNYILDVYEHLDQMSLDDTLHALDMITDKLISLQEEEQHRQQNHRIFWGVSIVTGAVLGLVSLYCFSIGCQ